MYALFKGAFNHFAIRQSFYKIYLILDKKNYAHERNKLIDTRPIDST